MVLKPLHYLAAHRLLMHNIPYTYYLRQQCIDDRTFKLSHRSQEICATIFYEIEHDVCDVLHQYIEKEEYLNYEMLSHQQCRMCVFPYVHSFDIKRDDTSTIYMSYSKLEKMLKNDDGHWFKTWLSTCHYPNMLMHSIDDSIAMLENKIPHISLPYTFKKLNLIVTEETIRSQRRYDFWERSFLNFMQEHAQFYEKIPVQWYGKQNVYINPLKEKVIDLNIHDGPLYSSAACAILDLGLNNSSYTNNLYMDYWRRRMNIPIPDNSEAQNNHALMNVLLMTLNSNHTINDVLNAIQAYYAGTLSCIEVEETTLMV